MKLTTIDVHTHFIPETYLKAIKDAGIPQTEIGFPLAPWSAKERLAQMDEYGIQAGVLSLSSPGLRFWKGQQAVDLGRKLNDELAGIMEHDPTRFGGYGTLPLPNVEASLQEISYCLDTLKMDGIVLMSNYDGTYLGAPEFVPVMDELNRRRAVVFVHPTEAPGNDQVNFGYPAPMVEYPAETTRMVVNLLDTDTITRCPDIRFIVSHGGGNLSILTPRIQELFPWKKHLDPAATAKKLKEQIDSLYYDMAIVAYPAPLLAINESHPKSRLMMGFDGPFMPAREIGPAKKTIADFKGFSHKSLKTWIMARPTKCFRGWPELSANKRRLYNKTTDGRGRPSLLRESPTVRVSSHQADA